MSKEAFGLSRQVLIDNGFIVDNEDTDRSFQFREIKGLGELLRFARLAKKKGEFRERFGENGAEDDPHFQQLIMYAVVFDTKGRYLLYERSKGEGYNEGRLAGKVSIGVGGHMESRDKSLPRSLYRELSEEIEVLENGEPVDLSKSKRGVKDYVKIKAIGFIKDDSDDVAQAHFGVVCFVDPKKNNLEIRIRIDNGENINSSYVNDFAYKELVESGQIDPEKWTEIIHDILEVPEPLEVEG